MQIRGKGQAPPVAPELPDKDRMSIFERYLPMYRFVKRFGRTIETDEPELTEHVTSVTEKK